MQLPSSGDSGVNNVTIPCNNTNLFDDYLLSTLTETNSPSIPDMSQLSNLDFSNLPTGSTCSSSRSSIGMAPTPFSTTYAEPGAECANANSWVLGSLCGANHISNGDTIDTGIAAFWTRNREDECNCHADVPQLLVSMRGGSSSSSSNDQRLSLDAQLAKLKHCIVSSETSMGCTHGHDSEPIHLMAVAMLIGYTIDGFKMLANESSLRNSTSLSSSAAAEMATLGNAERGRSSWVNTPNSTDISPEGLMEPRLSWGAFELEENDEMDLRQRLYLLSFRKLERLLSQLTVHLRDLHNMSASLPFPSQHMAFVIACDYTRLWLEKKAYGVKRLLSVSTRDETIDPALV